MNAALLIGAWRVGATANAAITPERAAIVGAGFLLGILMLVCVLLLAAAAMGFVSAILGPTKPREKRG